VSGATPASSALPTRRWPRISLVTPVRNSGRYLEAAMRSVLDQGYPDLEYIVIDGASSDDSPAIIRRYASRLASWTSEPDAGMYSALNKGFGVATGEILGWLSATDLLHRDALFVVGSVFADLAEVEWITGIPTGLSEDGMTTTVGPLRRWARGRFLLGANRYIQQESTFWRRSLWDRAGGRLDTEPELFRDFELWLRFFRHARLHTVRALVGGFRHHQDSGWLLDPERARRLTEEALAEELGRVSNPALRVLGRVTQGVRATRPGAWLWDHVLVKPLYSLPGPDWPPLIRHDGCRWRLGE
jgi:glycosyltransferase involved in cell wall biosynthesis